MRIRVKFFSIFRDCVGAPEVEIDVEGSRVLVRDVLDAIRRRWSKIEEVEKEVPMIVVLNDKVAREDMEVHENDEIAIIPPASGG